MGTGDTGLAPLPAPAAEPAEASRVPRLAKAWFPAERPLRTTALPGHEETAPPLRKHRLRRVGTAVMPVTPSATRTTRMAFATGAKPIKGDWTLSSLS